MSEGSTGTTPADVWRDVPRGERRVAARGLRRLAERLAELGQQDAAGAVRELAGRAEPAAPPSRGPVGRARRGVTAARWLDFE